MVGRSIVVKETEKDVISELCRIIEQCAKDCIEKNGSFHLGVSGGSLAKFLCQGLPSIHTDWASWKIFFCDERLVPAESTDSTWGLYRSELLKVTPLKESQFLLVDTDLEPEAAAKHYQALLQEHLGTPLQLHLLLLGAGPDGHTCSLFPGHSLLEEPENGRLVAHIVDSPKPPPARVTLTLPVVNSAELCVFAATGAGKADMMQTILGEAEPSPPLPARMVNPVHGKVIWILDSGAAANLPKI